MGEIYKNTYYNPFKNSNPINIDYNDFQRTRYFRIPGELVLLESYALISSRYRNYIYSHLCRRIFIQFAKCLNNGKFIKDSSNHRATATYFLYVESLVKLVKIKMDGNKLWYPIKEIIGWFLVSKSFGLNFSINLAIVLISIIGIIILFYFNLEKWAFVGVGIGTKTLMDFFKSIYNIRRSEI